MVRPSPTAAVSSIDTLGRYGNRRSGVAQGRSMRQADEREDEKGKEPVRKWHGNALGFQGTVAACRQNGTRTDLRPNQTYAPTKVAMRFRPLVMFSVLVA